MAHFFRLISCHWHKLALLSSPTTDLSLQTRGASHGPQTFAPALFPALYTFSLASPTACYFYFITSFKQHLLWKKLS